MRTLGPFLGPLAAGGATLLRLDVLRAVLRAFGLLGVVVGDEDAEAFGAVRQDRGGAERRRPTRCGTDAAQKRESLRELQYFLRQRVSAER